MNAPKIEKMKLDPKVLVTMGRKGKALIVIQSALILSAMNDFKGTNLKQMKKPKEFINSKAWKGVKNGDGGAYWQLKDKGATFNRLYKLAQPAQNSINKLEYDKPVKALINAFHAIPSLTGRPGQKIEQNSLKGLRL